MVSGVWGGWSYCVHSQEIECPGSALLLILTRTPAHGTVLLQFRKDLLASSKSVSKLAQRHALWFVSSGDSGAWQADKAHWPSPQYLVIALFSYIKIYQLKFLSFVDGHPGIFFCWSGCLNFILGDLFTCLVWYLSILFTHRVPS